MKKKIIVLLIVLIAGGIGFAVWQSQQSSGEPGLLKLYGNVEIREARLAFNGSEHIRSILVEEGDRVHQGQLLAQLDTELLEAQLASAQASLEAQRQQVNKLEGGSRPEAIKQAVAELAVSQAQDKAARDSYKRLNVLAKRKLASTETVEQARSLADAATARVDAARHALALLKEGPQQEDIAAAKANQAVRQAAVMLAKQRLEDASLTAPADGIIRNRILQPGDMAFPQTPVFSLAFIDPVWVRAYLPESALGKVKPGAPARIYTDSYPGKAYEGWVGYISPTAEFTPKVVQTEELRTRLVYSIRVYACNPEGELRLGMPASVEIDTTVKPSSPTQSDAASAAKHCGG